MGVITQMLRNGSLDPKRSSWEWSGFLGTEGILCALSRRESYYIIRQRLHVRHLGKEYNIYDLLSDQDMRLDRGRKNWVAEILSHNRPDSHISVMSLPVNLAEKKKSSYQHIVVFGDSDISSIGWKNVYQAQLESAGLDGERIAEVIEGLDNNPYKPVAGKPMRSSGIRLDSDPMVMDLVLSDVTSQRDRQIDELFDYDRTLIPELVSNSLPALRRRYVYQCQPPNAPVLVDPRTLSSTI